jgi:hypothetical protein
MGGIYEAAAETGSGDMIYISSFMKIDSAIQTLMGKGDTLTHREQGDGISPLSFLFSK